MSDTDTGDPDTSGPSPADAAAAKLAVGDLPQHMDALPQSALLDAAGDGGDETDERPTPEGRRRLSR